MECVTPDWDFVAQLRTETPTEAYRRILAWHTMMAELKRLGVGRGETVNARFWCRQVRAVFFGALYRIIPDLTTDLLTEEFDALNNASLMIRREMPSLLLDSIERREGEVFQRLDRANELIRSFVREWQERHNLCDSWITGAAFSTARLRWAGDEYGFRTPNPMPLILDDDDLWNSLHSDKDGYWEERNPDRTRLLIWKDDHTNIRVPVSMYDLQNDPFPICDGEGDVIDWDEDDLQYIGAFDPRTEDVQSASDRLIREVIRPRLVRRLEAIKVEDALRNGAIAPAPFKSVQAFEWLTRYQVLGESKNAIARGVGKDRGYVTNEVNRVAAMIGLTLRA